MVSLLFLAGHPSLRTVPPLRQTLAKEWNGMYELTVFLRLGWNGDIAEAGR